MEILSRDKYKKGTVWFDSNDRDKHGRVSTWIRYEKEWHFVGRFLGERDFFSNFNKILINCSLECRKISDEYER